MQILSGALPFYSKDSWQPKQFRGLALPMQKKKKKLNKISKAILRQAAFGKNVIQKKT